MKRAIVILICFCAISTKAEILIANFDSFPEGPIGTTFQDGEITFSEMVLYISDPYNPVFVIEDASESSWHLGLITPPNCLNFGGYGPGPSAAITPFGSTHISFEGIANMASIDVVLHASKWNYNNRLTLQAFLNDSLVEEDVLEVPDIHGTYQMQTSLSGVVFDDLRLVALGPDHGGAINIAIDNVHITLVPEPATMSLLGLGGLVLRRRK